MSAQMSSATLGVRAPLAATRRTRRARCAAARAAPVRAAAPTLSPDSEAVKIANSVGLTGLEEGMFGFKPFPELWVGRTAMMGFAAGLTNELVTGTPILQQLGMSTPDGTLFTALSVAIGGATALATARTLLRLTNGTMTVGELRRYSEFFGLNAEAVAAAEARERKRAGDFTSPTDLNAIDAARAAGTAADAALMVADATPVAAAESAAAAAAATAPAAPAPRRMTAEELEQEYARGVEMTNGRWAMLGFATAILIEAATGAGIVGQIEGYCKAVGLLGAQSGF